MVARLMTAAALTITIASALTLDLHLLPACLYPDAKCNDGTQSGYYTRLSPTGSNVWVVHAEGGG